MKHSLASCIVSAAALLSCQGDREPSPVIPYPNLSSPCRFQPAIDGLAASPETIRVGESTTLTAHVFALDSWSLAIEPGSSGSGVLTPTSGNIDGLRADFRASQPGVAVIVAYGLNVVCGTTTVVKAPITVVR